LLIQPTHGTYLPVPRELSGEVWTCYGQILPSPTLRTLHYIEPSTCNHHRRTMQLNIKLTLKFAIFFAKCEDVKCFLNPMMNTTTDKSKMLLRAELKGMSSALQIIAYRAHGAPMHHVANPYSLYLAKPKQIHRTTMQNILILTLKLTIHNHYF